MPSLQATLELSSIKTYMQEKNPGLWMWKAGAIVGGNIALLLVVLWLLAMAFVVIHDGRALYVQL